MFITGKRQVYPPKKKGGRPSEMYMGMSTKPAEKIGGYRLSRDDPTVFRDKNTFITCDRASLKRSIQKGQTVMFLCLLQNLPAAKLQTLQENRSRSPEP